MCLFGSCWQDRNFHPHLMTLEGLQMSTLDFPVCMLFGKCEQGPDKVLVRWRWTRPFAWKMGYSSYGIAWKLRGHTAEGLQPPVTYRARELASKAYSGIVTLPRIICRHFPLASQCVISAKLLSPC